jgi:hypothetical protein
MGIVTHVMRGRDRVGCNLRVDAIKVEVKTGAADITESLFLDLRSGFLVGKGLEGDCLDAHFAGVNWGEGGVRNGCCGSTASNIYRISPRCSPHLRRDDVGQPLNSSRRHIRCRPSSNTRIHEF